jgi:hypothetical protein
MKTLSKNGPGWTLIKLSLNGFLVLLTLCLFSKMSNAQSGTYEITSNGSMVDVTSYEEAMNSANFDNYRYQSKRRTISFVSGVEIELLSAKEIQEKGISVDASQAINNDVKIASEGVWKLSASGHILRTQSNQYPKQEKK